MKHDGTHYALLAAAWLAAIAGAGVLWRQAVQLPEAMPLDAMQRTVRKLRSDALEGERLARHLAAGQLTMNYAAQQHRKLRDDVGDLRQALDKPPPRGHEEEAARARAAAGRLDALLEAVPAAMVDAPALRRLADQDAALARVLPPTPP